MPHHPLPMLISGAGSNLQAIIEAIREHALPVEIRAVISNRPDAHGLLPVAIRWFAEGRLGLVDNRAMQDQRPLGKG